MCGFSALEYIPLSLSPLPCHFSGISSKSTSDFITRLAFRHANLWEKTGLISYHCTSFSTAHTIDRFLTIINHWLIGISQKCFSNSNDITLKFQPCYVPENSIFLYDNLFNYPNKTTLILDCFIVFQAHQRHHTTKKLTLATFSSWKTSLILSISLVIILHREEDSAHSRTKRYWRFRREGLISPWHSVLPHFLLKPPEATLDFSVA